MTHLSLQNLDFTFFFAKQAGVALR